MSETQELPSYTACKADWSLIPDYMVGGMRRWIEHGIGPGDFLSAVLINNLRQSFEKADETNRNCLFNYVKFLHNYAPSGCWGSVEKYVAWQKAGGLNGGAR